MAKLLSTPPPGHWNTCDCYSGKVFPDAEKTKAHFKAEEDSFEALGQTIRFPMGDGYALYQVVTISPPVLRHVPFGDNWRISDAHIRGLRAKDIQQMLDREEMLRKLFS